MSDSQEYTLRWRGREMGPYSVLEINRQLDEHEIGMAHEILYQDKWITLEEFFAAPNMPAFPIPPPASLPPAPSLASKNVPGGATRLPERSSPLRIKVSLDNETRVTSPSAAAAGRHLRPRHRMVFALLAIVAGFVGAHNFYARQWLTGLLQLLLSVATCLMGFGIIASWIWAMCEAVFVRKDGDDLDMI
jgi:hypothetical protein